MLLLSGGFGGLRLCEAPWRLEGTMSMVLAAAPSIILLSIGSVLAGQGTALTAAILVLLGTHSGAQCVDIWLDTALSLLHSFLFQLCRETLLLGLRTLLQVHWSKPQEPSYAPLPACFFFPPFFQRPGKGLQRKNTLLMSQL